MKRIFSFILAVLMLLTSFAACATVNNDDSVNTEAETSAEAVNKITYDGVFQIGYARVVITPDLALPQKDGHKMLKVEDDIYATCIAVYDGQNTALIYTLDVPNVPADQCVAMKNDIKKATKVPTSNIVISATHNHSSYTPGYPKNNPEAVKWSTQLRKLLSNVALEAIEDLTDATMYIGTGKTTGLAFVRRYLYNDGTYGGSWTGSHMGKKDSDIVSHASEADDTLQLVRFVREGKQDVVMTNWQAHLADAEVVKPTSVTADLAYYVRSGVEAADDDVLIAYFAGASGNINLETKIQELRSKDNRNYMAIGEALSKIVVKTMALDNLTQINPGKINVSDMTFKADALVESAERIAQAKEVQAVESNNAKKLELMKKYGFESDKHWNAVLGNQTEGKIDLFIAAFSIGDLALVAAPYEMFDTNGMQIKEGSPFDMTFVLTNAGGSNAYIASAEACNIYGGYETYQTEIAHGTAELLVAEYLRMLNDLKK